MCTCGRRSGCSSRVIPVQGPLLGSTVDLGPGSRLSVPQNCRVPGGPARDLYNRVVEWGVGSQTLLFKGDQYSQSGRCGEGRVAPKRRTHQSLGFTERASFPLGTSPVLGTDLPVPE